MKTFYENHYGNQAGDARVAALAHFIQPWLVANRARELKILDIGCGNMTMIEACFKRLAQNGVDRGENCHVTGWDLSRQAVEEARGRQWQAEERDIAEAPIAAEEREHYDLVICLEVIEHIADTELAVKNIHDLLKPGGIMILSTPNLAAWYNRFLLLFGFQPHMTEVSNVPIRFGCRFIGRLLGEIEGVTDISAGHMRLFTFRALKEFLVYNRFTIEKVSGVSNHRYDFISKVLSRFWVGGSGDLMCLARKKL